MQLNQITDRPKSNYILAIDWKITPLKVHRPLSFGLEGEYMFDIFLLDFQHYTGYVNALCKQSLSII